MKLDAATNQNNDLTDTKMLDKVVRKHLITITHGFVSMYDPFNNTNSHVIHYH